MSRTHKQAEEEGQVVWLIYYAAPYSNSPKFGGVFSSHEKAVHATKNREHPCITPHIMDKEEF